ncbi:hypothetical protein EVAR_49662_1 [Eumeta japonica]|uniref:Uncharacterized protein n=1 Tax=Eumeta variegata TaxID=151549 RepID=A0A4C1YCA5_EUMVA|nr:hypothetical protein EVAR_49662_1 [Eumeta japonica]
MLLRDKPKSKPVASRGNSISCQHHSGGDVSAENYLMIISKIRQFFVRCGNVKAAAVCSAARYRAFARINICAVNPGFEDVRSALARRDGPFVLGRIHLGTRSYRRMVQLFEFHFDNRALEAVSPDDDRDIMITTMAVSSPRRALGGGEYFMCTFRYLHPIKVDRGKRNGARNTNQDICRHVTSYYKGRFTRRGVRGAFLRPLCGPRITRGNDYPLSGSHGHERDAIASDRLASKCDNLCVELNPLRAPFVGYVDGMSNYNCAVSCMVLG